MVAEQKTNNRNEIFVFLMFFGSFLISGLFSMLINIDIIVFAISVTYLIYISLQKTMFLASYLYFFFAAYSNILGVFIIENTENLYLYELPDYSYRYNSFWLITFAWFIFFSVLLFFYEKDKVKITNLKNQSIFKIDKNLSKIILIILYILIFYLLFQAITQPAYTYNLDRFKFRREIIGIDFIWSILDKYINYMIPLVFIIWKYYSKKHTYLIIILYFIYLFLIGNKFGAFFSLIAYFLCLFFYEKPEFVFNKKTKIRIILTLTLSFIFLMFIVYIHRIITYESSNFFEYFFNRIAQEGQIWWSVYGQEKGLPIRLNELSDEFNVLFKFNVENDNHGMLKMMKKVMSMDYYIRKINSGSNLSFATFASIYYYFKEVGVILFAIIAAFLLNFITKYFVLYIQNRFFLESLIIFKLFMGYSSLFLGPRYLNFFSLENIILFGLLIIIRIISNKYTTKKHISQF